MFRKNIILESFQAAWKIFIITLSLARGQTPTLSISPSTIEIGSNYTLVCDVQINNAIKFFLDGNEQSNCPPPFIGGPCTPSDIVQGTGLTSWTRTATIAHVGNWTCARSNIESNVIVVEAYQCPDTVLSESGISANLELNGSSLVDITAKIACIYPTTNLDFQLQLIPSSGNTLSTNMTCTLSASSCTLGSAYDCSHQISDEIEFVQEMKYTVHVKAAPLSQSCEPLALFYPYTLTFKSTGMNEGKEDSCKDIIIYVVFFISTLIFMALTFFIVILLISRFKWKLKCFGKKGLIISIVITVDVLFQIIVLWAGEYESNFQHFKSGSDCNVTIIAVVCHLVDLVVFGTLKVFLLVKFMEKLRDLMVKRLKAKQKKKENDVEDRPLTHHANNDIPPASSGVQVAPRGHRSAEPVVFHANSDIPPTANGGQEALRGHESVEPVASPENIMLLLHFSMPPGYKLDQWVNEENTPLDNSDRYVTHERGTLRIKAATEKDNGIYQSILKSDDSEQRINVVLHVTGQKSLRLTVNPLVWMQIKSKKLKQIRDLKEISRHIIATNVANIPSNLKKNEETSFTITSIQWTHNGDNILGPIAKNTSEVPPLTVAMRKPIDEYHCTVEFTNKKSHVYIFIVKFTGGRADNNIYQSAKTNNKVDTIDEAVGVPSIINTKRNKSMTAKENQSQDDDRLHQMTARSDQSTGREENT